MWVYKAIIIPRLTYGSVIWHWSTEQENIKMELYKLQRLVGVMMSKCIRSTPTDGLCTILGMTPLNLVAKEKALKTTLRIHSQITHFWDYLPHNGLRVGTLKINYDLLNDLGIKLPNPKEIKHVITENIFTEEDDRFALNLSIQSSNDNRINIASWICHDVAGTIKEEYVRVPDQYSKGMTELTALIRAIEFLQTRE